MSTDGADGSIYFPARLHSAEEHLQWWSSVLVPDEVLQSIMDDYDASRTATIGAMVGGKWQAPPRKPEWSQAEYEARAREDADRHNEVVRRWQQQIPKELDRFAVRDAVRTHLAWTYRYTLPNDEQQQLETTQVTVGDYTGTPAEISTRYAMPGFAARHPEAFTRLPDDNADLKRQLEQLRRQVDTYGARASSHYAGYLAEHGHSSEQIDAALQGREPGAPVGQKKALKSFRKS
ncbi:hypothetical protein [Brachybacterium kimchii]|uniref:Uncharacterized protein n=1 Tax=Brachybacterium kimchii TaxID=2942909 RepID=A0ABY4N7E5_9MICO|nr:hypothetical protein [Brachybacterium kimchii]UQN30480.1 hypothetical protein M4486_03820 [Brachybacterium kimchii]